MAAIANANAGALGVLDLGRDPVAAMRALAVITRTARAFGVRVPEGAPASVTDAIPASAKCVIVATVAQVARLAARGFVVLAQVTSLAEAREAIAAGAGGLVAKGSESGGRVGEETAFVLVQHLVAELRVPVWAQGGIGVNAAAACVAGGAMGVVIDAQLALVRESSLPADVQAAIGAMDGSETIVVAGQRVYTRPDLPKATGDVMQFGADLHGNTLPLGQEAAFAKSLALRFPTAPALVRGFLAAMDRQLALAAELAPLAPDSPFAAAHGLHYPIAQGPMSRVSDRAKFAAAVAEAGALPFLALTLMTGAEVRALLEETRSLVGERPWGVGILGFVPPEVREQQLAVLAEIPPPVALIAGGRPSQAAPLEAQGTATYLHVPSPGLLDLFLKDGARRFVFEGRECGGHVGPRSSFALWEAQLERLVAHEDAANIHVLFAGGIHDARSAAMVAAMAAPLAARGAKIGVLMGTAYLFTDEAVAAGAIQPGFQEAAIACDRTVLLETAPGHATRCADTAFAQDFAREKARLEALGTPQQEVWAALETLNLGRLRIAAKGLRRDGAAIDEVDAGTQAAEGMFMIGQVAALRTSTCTVLDLHREVSRNGNALLAQAAARRTLQAEAAEDADHRGTDVAIIGIAAIMPGAPDTETFWANIVGGKNAVREVPPERWDAAVYFDPNATGSDAGRKTPCKWGGFLDDVPFDPLAYGIPPKSLSAIEPVQLLSLEIARRALADAGYEQRAFDRERTAVIFGAEAGTDLSSAYSFRALFPHYVGPLPAGLDESLPVLSEDSFPGVLSNVIAGRIANRLDLGGVNYTVDAACAASLAAMDMAVKELVSGTSDMVLCGGADLHNSINDYLMFASVHALSTTGQCHTFDAAADGIVLGEGVACVVLKRLADAERDGDRIYAVVKGVAGASDGKSLGLTAPRKDGQVRALSRAYKQAGVSPAQVGLVEAHGTGTIVGDRTELATLTEVFTRAGAEAASCVLGSVKSQIGHTKCAAGMAGLIKTALAIHHGVLPPTSNIKTPNPAWEADASPFVFLEQARPWPEDQRVAAVSAFGFGGTNFHAVLTSHTRAHAAAAGEPTAQWPCELFVFRGADRAAALAAVDRLQRRLAKWPILGAPKLRDLARSICSAAVSSPVQLTLVADSIEDLRAKLAAAAAGNQTRGVFAASPVDGKVAFLCPGQGSQRLGMLAELFVAFPRLRRLLELGAKWRPLMMPPAVFTREERAAQAAALTDTRVAQPALGVADLAAWELLGSLGVAPDLAGGHSYGELVALAIAGSIDEADLLALSEARGEAILASAAAAGGDPGTMLAVAASSETVAPIIASIAGVVIANHNGPKQCVLAGGTAAIERASEVVAAAGLTARRIPVACAFHSPIVAGARETLAARLATMTVRAPKIPVWSNATARPHDDVRAGLAAQVVMPVQFAQQIESMYEAGARTFVETGPGQVLTRLVGEILGDRPHLAVAIDTGATEPGGGLRALLRALAQLAAAGVPVDAAALFWGRDAALVELDPEKLPAARAAALTWLVNGHSARPATAPPVVAAGPRPIVSVPQTGGVSMSAPPSPSLSAATVGVVAGERESVVLEYLRTMRTMIAAQRDVMLSFLGSAPAPMMELAPTRIIEVAAPMPMAVVAAAPVAAAPAPVAAPVAVLDPMALVVSIVSERTGYPAETLGIDLDLEADLSIDSIKRIEIIGELAQRLGLRVKNGGKEADAIVEELARRKTLRALVAWLTDRMAAAPAGAVPAVAAASGAATSAAAPDSLPSPTPIAAAPTVAAAVAGIADDAVTVPVTREAPPTAPTRYTLDVVATPAPANGFSTLAGKRVVIHGDSVDGVAAALGDRLAAEGARVDRTTAAPDAADVFIELAPADSIGDLRDLFVRMRAAALAGARAILVVTRRGNLGRGALGGPAGMAKTLAAEYPAIAVRVVDLEPGDADPAARIHAELHAADPHVEIGYLDGVRSRVEPVPAPLAAATALPLDSSSVVLVTGGARGITARAAIALAERSGCRVELVGRSAAPGAEDPELAGAREVAALRRLLAKRGGTPAQIGAEATRVLVEREIRATLAALGARATYHACDVRTAAFGALIDEIYARHGRIDAVLHGAGVLEDKLVADKTPESFERVVATKLAAAAQLEAKLRPGVRVVAIFSSISGAFGNRGQVDYATAGDALDKLAFGWRGRVAERVVSIDWGPWAGAGMVSPELAREYARRGIALIEPDAGIAALLAELAGGADAQVVLTAADPRALVRRAAPKLHEGLAPPA
ncbi:MAG TPA: SDR family NAD(P)-dependent oxidoreductase [Kofleriaceae bacterium]